MFLKFYFPSKNLPGCMSVHHRARSVYHTTWNCSQKRISLLYRCQELKPSLLVDQLQHLPTDSSLTMTFKTLRMAILIISDNPIIIYTIGHFKGMIFQFIIFFSKMVLKCRNLSRKRKYNRFCKRTRVTRQGIFIQREYWERCLEVGSIWGAMWKSSEV